jgi:hypothetical protein
MPSAHQKASTHATRREKERGGGHVEVDSDRGQGDRRKAPKKRDRHGEVGPDEAEPISQQPKVTLMAAAEMIIRGFTNCPPCLGWG